MGCDWYMCWSVHFRDVCLFSIWLAFWIKSRRRTHKNSHCQIPIVSKDIKVDRVSALDDNDNPERVSVTIHDKSSEKSSEKKIAHLGKSKSSDADIFSQFNSIYHNKMAFSSLSGEDNSHGLSIPSPLLGLPELSQLGWGHWFMLRDLELATNRFSPENVVGEGGYGVVYRGTFVNGTEVTVKKVLNNLGQAEKEFRAEVEAIGHVCHKNLVRFSASLNFSSPELS